jgi:DNA polymerase delta subunit 2
LSLLLRKCSITNFCFIEKDQTYASKLCKLIIAGNALCKPRHLEVEKTAVKKISRSEYQQFDLEPLRELDAVLSQIAVNLDVELMPGENDATNAALPQQPLHPALFQNAHQYSTLKFVTNPYSSVVDGVS